MDELSYYLKHRRGYYKKTALEQILNKKIVITKKHIKNIYSKCGWIWRFNIITLFEKYGYCFTNDDYILLVSMDGNMIKYISEDNITDKICKIAIKQYEYAFRHIPDNKKTIEICKIAIRRDIWALEFIPNDKKTIEICKIAVRQNAWALEVVPNDKKTIEICEIAVKQNKDVLRFVPSNIKIKKHYTLFQTIKNIFYKK